MTRDELISDVHTRLREGDPPSGLRIYRSRLDSLPAGVEETICIYAPDERGRATDAQLDQFSVSMTLAIEARVAVNEDWDARCWSLIEWAKSRLFADPVWIAKFKPPMDFETRQFVVTAEHTAHSHCGEILTINLSPRTAQTFSRVTPAAIAGADITVDAIRPFDPNAEGGPYTEGPDGVVEAELNLTAPES